MVPPPHDLHPDELVGSHYQVLGIPFDAPQEEIRVRYHDEVRTHHPDRRRGGAEAGERFHQVQSAWNCLSNPTRRLCYDLRNFRRSSLCGDENMLAAEARLVDSLKEQAMRDINAMEVELAQCLHKEKAAKGVLIRQALYGNLVLRKDRIHLFFEPTRTVQADDLEGPLIDVTAPLQCQVVDHSLRLHGSATSSKADLHGFYNPAPLADQLELNLYVLYEFRGRLHEVIVGDKDTLSAPMRKHAVPPQGPRGPLSPACVDLIRCMPHGARGKAPTGASDSPVAGEVGQESPSTPALLLRLAPAQALARSVTSHRLHRLLHGGKGEVTQREFFVVLLGAGTALALAALWSLQGSRR